MISFFSMNFGTAYVRTAIAVAQPLKRRSRCLHTITLKRCLSVLKGLEPTQGTGRNSRAAHDNRRFLNGMLHVLRVGCPWRDMHERYGKWNSVYVRFRRWADQGVWDALLETLVELGLTIRAPRPCGPNTKALARYINLEILT